MTKKAIIEVIEKEYAEFKEDQLRMTKQEIYENCLRINAWSCIHDYLVEDNQVNYETLSKLNRSAGSHIISLLVDSYFDSEYCDICSYSDIKELIANFLEYR